MSKIWKEKFKIRNYEVDFRNCIKISSMFNYMQEAASNHADTLGFGYKDLTPKNQGWVLSRVILDVINELPFGEELWVETWPKSVEKIFAVRDFNLYDSKNKKIAAATTAWLLIDVSTKRPQRVNEINHHIPFGEISPAVIEMPGKIEDSAGKELILQRRGGYSDIDVNQHVNNARFIEFALDTFTEDFYKQKSIKRLHINFLSEMKIGEEMQIFSTKINENKYYIEGINIETKIFQMILDC